MSNLDPLAAFAIQAVANAQAAIEESTLNLGALLSDFQAQLSVGDVLSATVLPAENGSDRISLLGQTLAAQLPPGIDPGETIALQVTGFTNTAILVRNLGAADPENPPDVPLPPPQNPDVPQSAVLRSTPRATLPPSPQQAPPAPVAPPREIFVAASVRPMSTQNMPAQKTSSAPAPGAVEARLIATRASTTIGTPRPAQTVPQARVPQSSSVQSAVTRAAVERPPQAPLPLPSTPETALLARLRVPPTPTTIAAAKLVEHATRSVTAAFEKLDALLAKLPSDPRTGSLRSTLTFVARFDLRNARALPEQIASYVSNVVTGAESKIADIARAWIDADPPAEMQTPSQPAAPGVERLPQALPVPQHLASASPAIAHTAERGVALEHDVKAVLLALAADPPSGSSPQLVQALRDALTATTAVQLNALSPENNATNTFTIPLPAYFYDGGRPAQLRISRDAPRGKNPLDADNFHIAFVLDTKSLGTVAIDLQTVGRSVSVDIKTETARSADRFRTSLGELGGRLETLHYRVAAMAAGLVPRAKAVTAAPQAPSRTSNVDMQA